PHPGGRVEEQVGGGLAVGDLVAAEDAALEAPVEAGVAQGEAELVVAAAGGDTGRCGGLDLVEGVQDAVHRDQLGGVGLPVPPVELVLPVARQPVPELGLDRLVHVLGGPAHQALDDGGLAQRPAELGQELRLDPDGEALAVDQYAVAVEDDQVEAPGHARQLPSASARKARPGGWRYSIPEWVASNSSKTCSIPRASSSAENAAAPRSSQNWSRRPASREMPRRERSWPAWPAAMRTGSRASQRAHTWSRSRPVAGSKGSVTVPSGSAEEQAAMAQMPSRMPSDSLDMAGRVAKSAKNRS